MKQETPHKRGRRWLKWSAWTIAWLITLLVLFVTIENWRGRRAWQRYVTELESRGDSPLPEEVIPPPIPDERNFAAVPLLATLFEEPTPSALFDVQGAGSGPRPSLGNWWVGESTPLNEWAAYLGTPGGAAEALEALKPFEADLDALRAAARRPDSRFPIEYEKGPAARLPHVQSLLNGARLCALRAAANLSLQRPEDALADVLLGLRLATSLQTEPLLISGLVECTILQLLLNPIWQGISSEAWDDRQLTALDAGLAGVNLAAQWRIGIRGERNLFAFTLSKWLHEHAGDFVGLAEGDPGFPPFVLARMSSGWLYQNMVVMGRLDDRMADVVSPESKRFDPQKAQEAESAIEEIATHRTPYTIMAGLALPAIGPAVSKLANAQAGVDLARVALALERHHRLHGAYPPELAELDVAAVPEDGLPGDPMTGGPFRYSPTGETFDLYSPGWNGADEGGERAWKDSDQKKADIKAGDWPWPARSP